MEAAEEAVDEACSADADQHESVVETKENQNLNKHLIVFQK